MRNNTGSSARVAGIVMPNASSWREGPVIDRSQSARIAEIRSGKPSSHASASTPTRVRTAASNRANGSVGSSVGIGSGAYPVGPTGSGV